MTTANNNVAQLNLPVWELTNQAVTASGATSALVTAEDGSSRYLYYLTASTFYRYDTYADSWQQLATPNVAPVTLIDLSYTFRRGVHGRVISATSTTVTIGGLRGPTLSGYTMEVLRGTGLGQKKVLTYASDNVLDFGVITTAAVNVLTDSTKKWAYNQWAGCTLELHSVLMLHSIRTFFTMTKLTYTFQMLTYNPIIIGTIKPI